MSGSKFQSVSDSLAGLFFKAGAEPVPSKPQHKKRRSPFSLRFSDEEWNRLKVDAAGMPYAAYIKSCVFGKKRKRSTSKNVQLLARVLSVLGQSGAQQLLFTLIVAADERRIILDKDDEHQLRMVAQELASLRYELIAALGVKAE